MNQPIQEKGKIFKCEISIDGVAVILATISLCVWLVTLKNRLDTVSDLVKDQGVMLKDHQKMLTDMEIRNETTEAIKRAYEDHESRLRVLEKDADFLRISKGQ